jgi:hypothetical protein
MNARRGGERRMITSQKKKVEKAARFSGFNYVLINSLGEGWGGGQ